MARGILVPDKSLTDLVPRANSFGAGSFPLHDGAQLRYVILPEEPDHYAILTRDDGKGGVERYVASKAAFDDVAAARPVLQGGEYLDAFESLVPPEAPDSSDPGNDLLKKKIAGHDPGDENSLQTEQEANLQRDDVPLVRQIQDLYKTNNWSEFLKNKSVEQLATVVKVPDITDDGKIKWRIVVVTTYMGVGDSLIPEMTIFDDDNLYICSREQVKIETVKDFMYENVVKSTKISAGIGLSMGGGGVAAIGPKPGDPAYSKGEEAKVGGGASGPALSFSGEMVKNYAKLTIKANMRMAATIGQYKVSVHPRKAS